MECIGTGLGQNARVVCEMEVKLQRMPCFASFWCFDVQECLRDVWLVFLAQGNVKNFFEMLTNFVLIRWMSCGLFAQMLIF